MLLKVRVADAMKPRTRIASMSRAIERAKSSAVSSVRCSTRGTSAVVWEGRRQVLLLRAARGSASASKGRGVV